MENNDNNNQSSPPQLIAAVEFQIIRELQKMVSLGKGLWKGSPIFFYDGIFFLSFFFYFSTG